MWYLYDNYLWKLNEDERAYDMNKFYVQRLRTSGRSFWTEIMRGASGVCQYGAHGDNITKEWFIEIKENGEPWTVERLEQRLRYSQYDGGKMFDTFKLNWHPIKRTKQWFKSYFNVY